MKKKKKGKYKLGGSICFGIISCYKSLLKEKKKNIFGPCWNPWLGKTLASQEYSNGEHKEGATQDLHML